MIVFSVLFILLLPLKAKKSQVSSMSLIHKNYKYIIGHIPNDWTIQSNQDIQTIIYAKDDPNQNMLKSFITCMYKIWC